MIDQAFIDRVFAFLHAHPETALQEVETSAFIEQELKHLGFSVERAPNAPTGLVAKLDSGRPGKTFAIRADMDALPFEVDGQAVAYHACGHDAHSTMALAAAKALAEDGLPAGKLVMIFQPAEETGQGALLMVQSGLLDGIDEVVGMHLRPIDDTPLGTATPDIRSSAAASLGFRISGKMAHGARPHLGINAVEAGVLAVNAANAIKFNPAEPQSIKATRFMTSGSGTNSIPGEVTLSFDLRSEFTETLEGNRQKLIAAVKAAVSTLGALAEVTVDKMMPGSAPSPEMSATACQVIREVLGPEAVAPGFLSAGSEDFHMIPHHIGCKDTYVCLGAEASPGLHVYGMTFRHECMPHGAEIFYRLAKTRLVGN